MSQLSFKVFRASAGSGKTFTIAVQSIAQMMLTHGRNSTPGRNVHRKLLAVTFTNDATAEMKQRIMKELWTIAHTTKKNDTLEQIKETKLFDKWTDDDFKDVAGAIVTDMLHDYSNIHILTIDSFLQQLLRQLAHELGVGSHLNLDLDTDNAVSRAATSYVAKAETSDMVKKHLVRFLEQRIEDNKSWNVKTELEKFGKNMFSETYQQLSDKIEKQIADGNKDGKDLFTQVYEECSKTEKEIKKEFITLAQELLDNLKDDKTVNGNIIKFYEKVVAGEAFYNYNKLLNLTAIKVVDENGSIYKSGAKVDDRQNEKHCELVRTLREKLPRLYTVSAAKQYITQLRILTELASELHANLRKEGRFMLSDTAFLLSTMIGKNDASFIFERLNAQIDNVLIDEAQDTSRLQWDIFRNFVKEKLSNNNFGLIVGDVKQSIYRWRNSDWHILNDLDNDETLNLNSKENFETLKNNWRSYANVVNTNNKLFEYCSKELVKFYKDYTIPKESNQEQTDAETQPDGSTQSPIEKAYKDLAQTPQKKDKGFVQFHFCPKEDEDKTHIKAINKGIVNTLQKLLDAGVNASDITILQRKSTHTRELVESIKKGIKNYDFDIITDRAFVLGDNIALKLIIATLRLVKSPREEIYRGMVLTLQAVLKNDNPNWTLPTTEEERDQQLPETLQKANIHRLQNNTLQEIIFTIINTFELNSYQEHAAYLFTFVNEVAHFADTNVAILSEFLNYWDITLSKKMLTNDNTTNGLRITTIHKSKGLEYHTVIVPIDETLKVGSSGAWHEELIWSVPDNSDKEALFKGLPTLPVVLKENLLRTCFSTDYKKEVEMRLMDLLNVTYVALTRAKCNLVVVTPEPTKKEEKKSGKDESNDASGAENMPSLLYDFAEKCVTDSEIPFQRDDNGIDFTLGEIYPSKQQEKSTAEKATQEHSPFENKDATTETVQFPMLQLPNNVHFICSEQTNEYFESLKSETDISKDNAKAIEKGLLLHTIFEHIASWNDVNTAIKAERVGGRITSDKQEQEVRKLIVKRITQAPAKRWFDGSWKLYNECNILVRNSGTGKTEELRPDRVMCSDSETIVVDYKFGRRRDSYKDQVRQYVEQLRQMGYPDVKGYIWYVFSNNIDEVK
ncbi:MAG: UvrD-helicase domain-containing protein [Bacteroidales bacterium]|nr:UvrD-helicase domain-containing protein [Bacteroidales bacterium]